MLQVRTWPWPHPPGAVPAFPCWLPWPWPQLRWACTGAAFRGACCCAYVADACCLGPGGQAQPQGPLDGSSILRFYPTAAVMPAVAWASRGYAISTKIVRGAVITGRCPVTAMASPSFWRPLWMLSTQHSRSRICRRVALVLPACLVGPPCRHAKPLSASLHAHSLPLT